MRHTQTFGLVVMLVLGSIGMGLAQGQSSKDEEREATIRAEMEAQEKRAQAQRELVREEQRRDAERTRLIPLSVEVVVSRYQGEKRISSLPYSLAVNANDAAAGGVCQLRMGASVPIPSIVAPAGNPAGPAGPMPGPVTYRDIGTNIDCSARAADMSGLLNENGFQLRLTVEDTSVYTNVQDATTPTIGQMPVFRTFRSTNTLVLRDGQTREFTAAADRVSGEVIRIAVTLRVVK